MQTGGPSPGSCGYGTLEPAQYPYGAVLSILSTDPLVAGLPLAGCGACFAITCNDPVSNTSTIVILPQATQLVWTGLPH